MKKIGTVTFHSSYNYGSSLQAYALQEVVKKICNCKYEIINLRPNKQKYMYSINRENRFLSKVVRKFIIKNYKEKYLAKNKKFEDFINNKLNITKEYNSLEEIKNDNLDYDYYISGSDQLWNTRAYDFDWAYFLSFTAKGQKISYAASFGPKAIEFTEEEKEKIKKYISQYKALSVREEGSYQNIYELTGKKAQINMDPTILLDKQEWESILLKEKVQNGEYILYYSLGPSKEDIKLVKKIAKKLKLPVITTLYGGRYELFSGFKQVYEVRTNRVFKFNLSC
ncbi:MAG: polysaccharide pyruvyl transferase family protein [Clostridia bacterium]|jgi:hypothetical protein|nr:polysaccharide pyruvyl transferase family protein [Clostridia bacterium]